DDAEKARNEKVYTIQGNRNPFIDHSEWVNTIWVTDSNSPATTNYSPENGSTAVLLTGNLSISFTEEVQEGTGSISIRHFEDDSEFETLNVVNNPRVSFTNNTVLVNPEAIFKEGTKYYVTIESGAITDASSNAFDGISNKTIWNFTATYTPPVISDFTPIDNSVNIPINTELEITFDKNVQAGNGNISIQTDGDEIMSIPASTTTFDGEIVTIQLTEELESGTEYSVLIDENAFISDNGVAFEGISSDEDWTFTTEVITGINDLFRKATPSFYPNPAVNEIRLTNMKDVESMYISNLTGRNIMEIKSPDTKISISKLPKGMYFVTFISSNGSRITKKLLKR
ncbi:MAG: Ig-like domain-containing protein, partial [Labilibaculum sp.]|nr:Ig-like domain-containing protein [Labilibaculum sp.]